MSEASIIFQSDSVTPEALAHLGEGHIAYVKQVRSEDVPDLFPQAPKIAPGTVSTPPSSTITSASTDSEMPILSGKTLPFR